MNRILLTNYQCPGDILVLTAAVRDLVEGYPHDHIVFVDTTARELWANNPKVQLASAANWDSIRVHCEYPLIHSSNTNGRHFATAFHDHLTRVLGVPVQCRALGGEVFLSEEETSFPRLLPPRMKDTGYWLLVAGGKFDFTAKWWPPAYYRALTAELGGTVEFVQVGHVHDYHPLVEGAYNLVGRTSLRDLISLTYWASGVVCPVTFLMHLAVATPPNSEVCVGKRPCVVLAGGREPLSWNAYPGHRYLNTVGMLTCCETGGCWISRTYMLNDGKEADRSTCFQPVDGYPKCMRMLTPAAVASHVKELETWRKVELGNVKQARKPHAS